MLSLAFWTLALTVPAGAALGLLFLRPIWPRSPLAAAMHGIVGSFGLAILALSLKAANSAAVAHGVGSFATYAAILIGLAWVAGLVLAFLPIRSRNFHGALIGGHGLLAVAGFLLLLAFWVLG